MQTLARIAVQKRWYVIAGWIVFIIGAQFIAGAAGGASYKDVFTLPHTETQKVLDLLQGRRPGPARRARSAQWSCTPRPARSTPSTRPTGSRRRWSSSARPSCTSRASPHRGRPSTAPHPQHGQAPGNTTLLSKDDRVGIVNITWQGNENDVKNFTGVYDRLKGLDNASTQYEFTGGAFANLAEAQKGIPPEVFGFIAALIILGLVFRTIGAAITPLLSAAAALGSGLAIISLLSHAMNVATFATQLAQLMVIGVGVDYALFIVTRHRRNLLRGMSVPDSIALSINTSGRAVLFAGATVCVAILGLVRARRQLPLRRRRRHVHRRRPDDDRVADPAAGRVVVARVEGAAAQGAQGHRRPARTPTTTLTRLAGRRWADFVAGNKAVLGCVAAADHPRSGHPVLLDAARPRRREHRPGGQHHPQGLRPDQPGVRQGLQLDAGTRRSAGRRPPTRATSTRSSGQLATVPGVDRTSVHPSPIGKNLSFVEFKTTTSPQDPKTTALVKSLRRTLTPQLEKTSPNQAYVFGQTAVFVDFSKVLAAKMPLFFLAIIGLSFLLLMLAFRSLLIPATAAVMNLFAAGASFGIVVAIFQWGWFSEALGIGTGGPIDAFLPVLFFAILFGLSMDYQVFLVSRMHEEWVHTADNRRAIRVGQAETGGIITAAAFIMIAVFGGFILGDARAIKLIGIGLGGAIFLDAFILRTVLVPSLMHMFGRANWYFPKWLDRITPQVSVEPADDHPAPEHGEEPEGHRLARV